jgi:hypothetical protein
MTVSSTTVKNSYSGNGSTTVFAYTYRIFADSDLQVIIRSAAGTETTKTITTHYTVAGAGNANGGSVTFTPGNVPTATETVVLRREVPQTQAIDYIANDPFPAESHEEGLDRATMNIQQLQEEVDRSIKLSRTNTMTSTEFTVDAADRANKILAFDSTGEISVTQELGTYKGTSPTTTTEAFVVRDIVKGSTPAELNNIYICILASPVGTLLTNATYWVLIVDAVSAAASATAAAASAVDAQSSADDAAADLVLTNADVVLTHADVVLTGADVISSAASAAAAAASADAFDDVYLGSKATDPTLDNDGDPLTAGDLYFNTTSNILRVYNGSAWQDAAISSTGVVTLTGTQTLTNKTLTSPKINEAVDLTSTSTELNLLDGVVGLVQADFTKLADVDATAAELNYSDLATLGTTAASKVFTADANNLTIVSGAIVNVEDILTDGATITWDVIDSPVAKVTLGGNRTLSAPSGTTPFAGQFVSLLIIQDGTGGRTVTWNAVYEFAADTAPTLTATASLGDLFTFRYNGAKWLEVGRNLALTLS